MGKFFSLSLTFKVGYNVGNRVGGSVDGYSVLRYSCSRSKELEGGQGEREIVSSTVHVSAAQSTYWK
jgi:hypothetical protein